MIRVLPLMVILVVASPVLFAQEAPKVEKKDAAVSFSGKGGGPIKVVDQRTGETATDEGAKNVITQLSPDVVAREEVMRAEIRDQAGAALEAYQKKQAEDAELAAKQAAEAEVAQKEAVEEKIDVAAGLKELRLKNWITYTQDDKHFPEVVFDPFTRQLVPTLEAIKSLRTPPAPETRESLTAKPEGEQPKP